MGLFGGGGSDTEEVIVGYKYFVGMHLILCTGSVDGIKKIYVGDKVAWEGSAGTTSVNIIKPELFGGEKKEGGVEGIVDFEFGLSNQGRNSYLQAMCASDCPAFRHLCGVVLRQVYYGTSPYAKPWSFIVQRITLRQWATPGGSWYAAKEKIGNDLNPAHIIYSVLTSQEYGKGVSTSYLDEDSFFAAADTLFTESFGLSFLWASDMTPDDFILEVLKHIDGIIYQDMTSGKYVLSLARDDYTVGALDLYDEDDIIDVTDFTRTAMIDIPNWVVVKFHDLEKNEPNSVTAHDMALIDKQNLVVPVTHDRPGITEKSLANQTASKLLKQYSAMLAKMTIIGNRNFAGIRPNDMIKINWSLYGMVEVPLRVLAVDYGDLTNGRVKLTCSEDVFSAGEGVYEDPDDSLWTEPTNPPYDPTYFNIIEMPYQAAIDRGWRNQDICDALDEDDGYTEALVAKPTTDAINYQMWLRTAPAEEFANYGDTSFTPTGTIADSGGLPQDVVQAVVAVEGTIDLSSVPDDSWAVIDDEFVEVVSVDTLLSEITIKRGIFDTVPAAHSWGTRIWFCKTLTAKIGGVYVAGDTPAIKTLTRTAQGTLDYSSAATKTMSPAFNSRIIRPYAPGNFKINTVSYPDTFNGQPALTWSHRNRKTQLGTIVDASEAGAYSLEAGVTYTLEIYGESGVGLLRTVDLFTDAFYTYSELDERSDSGLNSADPLNTTLRFVLKAVLDDSSAVSYDSWQEIDFTCVRV